MTRWTHGLINRFVIVCDVVMSLLAAIIAHVAWDFLSWSQIGILWLIGIFSFVQILQFGRAYRVEHYSRLRRQIGHVVVGGVPAGFVVGVCYYALIPTEATNFKALMGWGAVTAAALLFGRLVLVRLGMVLVRRKAVHDAIIDKLEAERGVAKPKPAGIPAGSRPVLMAVAGKNGLVAEHFGHAREFLIYEASPEGVRFIGHRKTELYCGGMDACGDGDVVEAGASESLLDRNIRILSGCEVVLCAKVGYEPWAKLEAAGIAPNGEHAMEPIEEAVMAVYEEIAATGRLLPQADSLKVA